MIALLLAAAVFATQQPGPRIQTALDTAVVTVGDRLHLSVAVTHGASEQVRWPDSLDLKPFEILDRRTAPANRDGDMVTDSLLLELTVFELGEIKLPSFDVTVEGSNPPVKLATDGWTVTVQSVVAGDSAGDIRDVKAPLSIPRNWLLLLPWILGAGALGALGWWLYRRYQRRARPPAVVPAAPPVPAHTAAYAALDALERSDLLDQGRIKEYYGRGSDILRRYFEERYGIQALEMATVEVLRDLGGVEMEPAARSEIERLLESCDLVKFAKLLPPLATCRELVPAARRIVDLTREPDTPPRFSAPVPMISAETG